ncbi:MAG: UbiA family prenyltransferase, partial [Desulfovibrio sp.]|nr:UbiA family prenyltransferase [Desulfovibrio sp.]
MDSTLLRSDSLYEGLLVMVGTNLYNIRKLLASRSIMTIKNLLVPYIEKIIKNIPINERVLDYLKDARSQGRTLVLVTASPLAIAQACAGRVGIFDDVYGSSTAENLRGPAKAEFLCKKYGEHRFDYIGNSLDDIPVWECAKTAIIASNNKQVIEAARKANKNIIIIPIKRPHVIDYIKALRINQYIKNILVFVPLLLAHSFSGFTFINCLLAFISLSLSASSIYIINDLVDIDNDRHHPQKKNRPFASASIPLAQAPLLFFTCTLLS